MPRTDSRGGPQTRDRIAQVASRLFSERGFEGVTVAEVAAAADVSSVTVFKYFPKKEDLFFDRSDEITRLLLTAVADRATPAGVLEALRGVLIRLADDHHPVSGLDARSVAFFGTIARSATLVARARQIAADIQTALTRTLVTADFAGDAGLTAAFFVAGYTRILTETGADLIAGEAHRSLERRHRRRIERLLTALADGVLGPPPSTGR